MDELIAAAFSAHNIVFTVLLLLCFSYWLFVIVGALDLGSLDFDLDLDADVDVDVDVDVDADVDADVEADAGGGGSWVANILRFFNFGVLPFMLVMTLLLLSMWSISMLCNHPESQINPNLNWLITVGLVLPNLIVSLLITKVVTTPLVPIFSKLDSKGAEAIDFTGKIGELTVSASRKGMGQARIDIDGGSRLIYVRTESKEKLPAGTSVIVIDEVPSEKYYIVKAHTEL